MENETITFTSCDGRFTYTVLKTFAVRCSDYSNITPYELSATHKIATYLHNDLGPALIYNETQVVAYYTRGKRLTENEVHRSKFYQKMDDILNDE